MGTSQHAAGPRWKTLLCFGIIYFVWGSTFLAIRVGVREMPPLLMASMRFFHGRRISVRVDARARRKIAHVAAVDVGFPAGHRDFSF